MKFTCERCSAQYMISDDKVGPAGVKVRCKKCGNVIHVKRAEAGAADAPAPAAAATPGPGLDAELGQAFDSAFGSGDNPDATQAMTSEDAAKIAAAPAPPAGEWYVAIGQAQVGPLPLSEVKKKWEGGEIGPDSLVWRPGMGDWVALSSVQDLAGYLAPFARAAARVSRPAMEAVRDGAPRYGTQTSMPAASLPAAGTPAKGTPAAPADPAWKPAGASALAALASEEIAARNAPEPAKAAAPAAKAAGGSLVDAMNLPDGGVDPTGAIPLAIKGMEKTEERKVSSIAATAAKQRRSRGMLVGILVTLLVVVGGAAAAVFTGLVQVPGLVVGRNPQEVAAAPAPAPAPLQAAPAPAPTPPPAAVAAAPAAAPPAAVPTPTPPAPEPAKAEPPPRSEPVAAAPASKRPVRETRTRPGRKETVARAEPASAPAQPPAKKSGGGGVLDFDDGDAALKEALGGSAQPSGRSVYVPPAPGGGGALPASVSTSQIQESVASRVDALQRCLAEQKARDPEGSGTMKMAWTIMGDGTPRDVRCATPEFANSQFAACVGGVIKNIRFPKSQTTGQPVTFPFSFK